MATARAIRTTSLAAPAVLAVLLAGPAKAGPAPPPAWLPRYDLTMGLDVGRGIARGTLRATWTNPHPVPASRLVFNAHSRYVLPERDVGLMAKTLELLRLAPSDAMGIDRPALEVHAISLPPAEGEAAPQPLPFRYEGDTLTALVVPLPHPVGPGESVTVDLEFTFHLPPKQGRWGQWKGITYLATWLPVFAYYGPGKGPAPEPWFIAREEGNRPTVRWQPTPFIPWHQPFFNEAGVYRARVALPADQKVACSGTILSEEPLPGGRKEVHVEAVGVRDFAFLCSARYAEFEGEVTPLPGGPPVRLHVRALPGHAHYARRMLRIAADAITAYSRWFGPYPYPDFTIAESYFGWNGNECGTLVMIDERVFAMPHLADAYADYLVSHEICHQWWYNLVGTDGYTETWMDEGLAVHFSHRLADEKVGKNNAMLRYPRGLGWLPNIRREDYRSAGLYAAFGRGANSPVVQEMPSFRHLSNLFSMTYDKGSRVVGMIEARLGPVAFLDFMRLVHHKYRYRILRVADFHRELEAYTGESWREFFDKWIYGDDLTDWAVAEVEVEKADRHAAGRKVTVCLEQRAGMDEHTVLGFALPGHEGFPVRVPILPRLDEYPLEDPPGGVRVLERQEWGGGPTRVKVEVELPDKPTQVMVDPDRLLVDAEPANNFWKPEVRWRFAPVYTVLEETDLTAAYDRWNVTFGPWVHVNTYADAWYARTTMLGFRAGAYRTQQFWGGVYAGYRTDYHDVVGGVDGTWDHFPGEDYQVGFNVERRLTSLTTGEDDAFRAVVWGRRILLRTSSLYLRPAHFVEVYALHQDNFLPLPHPRTWQGQPQGVRFDEQTTAGVHYQINYLTPYWDPEGGFKFDAAYEGGVASVPEQRALHKLSGEFVAVKPLPDLAPLLDGAPGIQGPLDPFLRWLADTRLAVRLYGATSVPDEGEFFTLGGPSLFRGFDLARRQGSSVWVGSLEWRVPLARRLTFDAADHVVGLRNVYAALFYDVGDAYVGGGSLGPVAHGVGAGLRLDVSWFGFVERSTLRLDVAKAVGIGSGVQVWLGVQHPF